MQISIARELATRLGKERLETLVSEAVKPGIYNKAIIEALYRRIKNIYRDWMEEIRIKYNVSGPKLEKKITNILTWEVVVELSNINLSRLIGVFNAYSYRLSNIVSKYPVLKLRFTVKDREEVIGVYETSPADITSGFLLYLLNEIIGVRYEECENEYTLKLFSFPIKKGIRYYNTLAYLD